MMLVGTKRTSTYLRMQSPFGEIARLITDGFYANALQTSGGSTGFARCSVGISRALQLTTRTYRHIRR
ncbi:MAG: hypothetical protein CK428_33220 [Mycobacterium sp.]|nr:MAG: hypothetical protein CK428_33220 [Mycobacterium sp.]